MLRSYLAQLESELSGHLPPEDVRARLVETEAHLLDGVEGRLELGMSKDDAESETVIAFGDVHRLVVHLRGESLRCSIVGRLRWIAGVYAGLVLLFFGALSLLAWSSFAGLLPIAGLFTGGVGLAVLSFRARRAIPIPIAATGIGASLALWVVLSVTMLNLGNYGGAGYCSRWEIASLRLAAMAPSATGSISAQGRHTAIEASGGSQEFLQRTIDASAQALADPWGNALSLLGSGCSLGMEVAAAAVLLDVVAAGLGGLWVTRRRRRDILA